MADLGVLSGFIGKAIDLAVDEIIDYIRIAVRCRRELTSLEDSVRRIGSLNSDIQHYALALNSYPCNDLRPLPPSANEWLKQLNEHLENASDIVEQCRVPRYNMISRYQLSTKITSVIAAIREHLQGASLVTIATQFAQMRGTTTVSGSGPGVPSSPSSHRQPQRFSSFHEPHFVVGQDDVFERLHSWLIDVEESGPSRIGVVGLGGAGKTLLLRRLYNHQDVQDLFGKKLVLWLTISQTPLFPTLRIELATQLFADYSNKDSIPTPISRKDLIKKLVDKYNGKDCEVTEDESDRLVKRFIDESLKESGFVIFLDDVWQGSESELLEELRVPRTQTSKVIVSTRDHRVLRKMGVTSKHAISIERLPKTESWELFRTHAFPDRNGIPPEGVRKTAENICKECDGLPLALKVIGAAMAGATDGSEWDLSLQRLRNADKLDVSVQEQLYDRLRLSYEALGKYDLLRRDQGSSLQLCFVYLGSFQEDEVMNVTNVTRLWIGEGLLGSKNDEYDPFVIGRTYVNILLDRCLIEANDDDMDGDEVFRFRMHDVLYDLARQIAAKEESCLFRAGQGLKVFPDDENLKRYDKISLRNNELSSIPESFRGPHIRSLLLSQNKMLEYLPASVIESLRSIRVLDLRGCSSLRSLPATLGCMKHLVCLRLSDTKIKTLPKSITFLKKLRILDLSLCFELRKLPRNLNKLISLRHLDLFFCEQLKYIPSGISRLTSLQSLQMYGCYNAWRTQAERFRVVPCKRKSEEERRACCLKNRLHGLTQLKTLGLSHDGKAMTEGTLGSITKMSNLTLRLRHIEALPDDIRPMSQLRRLFLICNQLVKMPSWVCEFEHLHALYLECSSLEELPALQKLGRLSVLTLSCGEVEELPAEFGEEGAFPALLELRLLWMRLKGLPQIEKEAMPILERLLLVNCPDVGELPEGVFHLPKLKNLEVSDCALLREKMERGGEYRERMIRLGWELSCHVQVVVS